MIYMYGSLAISIMIIIWFFGWGEGFDDGQVSVASGEWTCEIVSTVDRYKITTEEWICKLNKD